MKKSFFGQLLARLQSETPVFFKTILNFGVTLVAVGGALIGAKELSLPVPIPEFLFQVAGYMVTGGTLIGIVAKSATTNPTLQAQGGSNVVVNDKHDGESTPVAKAPEVIQP